MSKAEYRENPKPSNTSLHTLGQSEHLGGLHPLVSKALVSSDGESKEGWTEADLLGTTDPALKGSLDVALQDTDTHPPDTTNPNLAPQTPTSLATEVWGTPPPTLTLSDPSDPDPRAELLNHAIMQLYLRGYGADAIGRKVGISYNKTRRILVQIKQRTMEYMVENPQVFGAPLELIYTQTLRRRERQSALWEELETATMESIRPQYYRLIAEEDKAIENLLGMDHRTLSIAIGTPAQHATADLLKQMGPDGLKDILVAIRDAAIALTGQPPTLESTQTIEHSVRELAPTPAAG